ncbi:hypothetical protein EV2_040021 [Malus domestica]
MSTSVLYNKADLQEYLTLPHLRECIFNKASRNTQFSSCPRIPLQNKSHQSKSISYHQGRKQEYLISCFLYVLSFVLVLACKDKDKESNMLEPPFKLPVRNLCLEPLLGCLPCIALEYSSSTVDMMLAIYTEAATHG